MIMLFYPSDCISNLFLSARGLNKRDILCFEMMAGSAAHIMARSSTPALAGAPDPLRTWHTYDSQGQIPTLASRHKALKYLSCSYFARERTKVLVARGSAARIRKKGLQPVLSRASNPALAGAPAPASK